MSLNVRALVAILVLVFIQSVAGRQLTQAKQLSASILLVKQSGGCMATVIVTDPTTSPPQVVRGATVTYKWSTAATMGSGTTNGFGRFSSLTKLGSDAKSCTLQLVDVSVPGATVALSDAARAGKTVRWQ